MEIAIKKPCHENWDAMTPNEQGAFCGKCVKTVIDFTNHSLDEIKAFFTANSRQNVCGRFEEDQLSALSFDTFFKRFRRFEFTRRFALILFFTFSGLFGVQKAQAQTSTPIKGDVMVEEPIRGKVQVPTPPADTTKPQTPPSAHPKIVGKVMPTRPQPPVKEPRNKPKPVKPVKPDRPQPPIMGAVRVSPPKE